MSACLKIHTIYILVHLCCICLCQQKICYDGYSLYRVTPITQTHLEYLQKLNAITSGKLAFWLHTSSVNNPADVIVEPSIRQDFIEHLNSMQMPFIVLIDDIGKTLEDDVSASVTVLPGFEFFTRYREVSEINQYMNELVSKYPNHTSLTQIGSSFEDRPLQLIQISTSREGTKPAIWIQGGAHAREQIGPAVVIFIAEKLASLYGNSEEANKLMNSFDWYILPVLNPDGYEYCQKTDRLWRKTRSRHANTNNCIGVDANRNWDVKWNAAAGSSSNPCSQNYAGPTPFSEPETKSTSRFMLEHLSGRLELFLDFHSYSQRWLTPWGYTSDLPPNYQQQKELAEIAALALETVEGTKYSVGSTGNIMYTVSGGARDWVYDVMDAKYSYVVELRDKGEYGFVLPKRLILPTASETWEGVKAMGLELAELS